MPRKLTKKEAIIKANLVHNNKYDYSKFDYTHSLIKTTIICPINGHGEFEQAPVDHLRGGGCKKCGHNIPSSEDVIIKSNLVHDYKYTYPSFDYTNNTNKIEIMCPIGEHGIFKQMIRNHLRGDGCPKCCISVRTNRLKDTIETFINKANIIHKNIYNYDMVKYINNHTKIEIICPKKEHGTFCQTPANHLKGRGCPICSESRGEKIIRSLLNENNILYIPQKRFADCRSIKPLPFDFYLPDHDICIEYHGRQHYIQIDFFGGEKSLERQKERDRIKATYCLKKNIFLVIIPYNVDIETEINKIKQSQL